MRITENRLREIIRCLIKESSFLVSESLIRGAQIVDQPTVLNAIVTDVREFCSPSMLYDYNTLGYGVLCDMIECQDFIAALYSAESKGIKIPNFSAKIVPTQLNGMKTIQVNILGPVSEAFVKNFDAIQLKAAGKVDPSRNLLRISTVNDGFVFSAEDNVKIINSTTVMN